MGVDALTLAPKNPLPYWQRLKAVRSFVDGFQTLVQAGGPVTRIVLGPKWLFPNMVLIGSPQGARDLLGASVAVADRGLDRAMVENRTLFGGNLVNLPHERWLPRRRAVQPMFTKHHVPRYAGHMSAAAQAVADGWRDGAVVDLDTECRTLTLRALGHSLLGADLAARANEVHGALRAPAVWLSDRSMRPINLPRWVPTRGQRAARRGKDTLHRLAAEILHAVRADPEREAPLVRSLIEAVDPKSGGTLTDDDICAELVMFMLAGHDTIATTLTYALWSLGRCRETQERMRAEADALGDRALTPNDVAELSFTVRVVGEALRLCPAVPATVRLTSRDMVVGGYRVEAGTMAVVSMYALHRDPALWTEPLRFDPDRYLPERSKGRSRWQYLPFGGGPRSCLGDHFAILEATLALATVIRAVEIQSLDPNFPLDTPFTVAAAGPIHARTLARHRLDVD